MSPFPKLFTILLFTLVPTGSALASAQEPPKDPVPDEEASVWNRFSLEGGAQLDSGKYGGKHVSSFLSLPVTAGYDHDGVIASVSVPYVVQKTHGNVVRVGGRPVRVGGKVQRMAKTHGGLGDVLVDAGYYVFDSENETPYLLLEGEVKIPTADDERHLGTGSADETIRATTGSTLFGWLKLTADIAYQFIGQPEDIPSSVKDFHNAVNVGGGIGWKIDSSNLLWAKFDGSTAIVSHTPPYELIYLQFEHTFQDESRLLLSAGAGLTTSSPDLSVELSYLIWF